MEVKILGRSYAIKSDHDDQFAQEAAGLVDKRIREMTAKNGPIPSERVAILVALNFAGELLEMKRRSKDRDGALKQKISKVMKSIELLEKKTP